MTPFLTIFLRFPTTLRRFPKIFQHCSEGQTNVSEHFSVIPEHFSKIAEDCPRGPKMIRRCFDHTPTNSRVVKGTKEKCYQTWYQHETISYRFRSPNRGGRLKARAISSIAAVPIIWYNFSIFRTNYAFECGTRACTAARIFTDVTRRNGVLNSQNVWCFRPKAPYVHACWNFTSVYSSNAAPVWVALSEVRHRWIWSRPITDQVMICCVFTRALHFSILTFTYVEDQQLFHNTAKICLVIYLDIAALQDFKVSLISPHACENFARVYHYRKVKLQKGGGCIARSHLNVSCTTHIDTGHWNSIQT